MDIFNAWQLWCIAGVVFFIIEMFTPVMFFFNLALACFIAAICAAFGILPIVQVIIFDVFSVIFLIWLRPVLVKYKNKPENETVDMYTGKAAKVIKTVTKDGGRIYIFDEEWPAVSLNENDVFNEGEYVKIVKTENMLMYVEGKNAG